MNTTAIGRAAEVAARNYLEYRGYILLAQNWRTRWCEIDLVMHKDNTIYFTEVKYRASTSWGTGLEYITPRKLQQMQFAANFWLTTHPSRCNYALMAIAATGNPPEVTDCLTLS